MFYRLKLISIGHKFPDIERNLVRDDVAQAVEGAVKWLALRNAVSNLRPGPYVRWEVSALDDDDQWVQVATGDVSTPQRA